jgi:hypothetical protein
MNEQESEKIRPKIHDLSAFKQIMESRAHPLDMLRESLSNMMAPEVNASSVIIQHFSHQDYNSSFAFKDDGIGMTFTNDEKNPGRLDRFIGLAFSRAAGLKADYWGWKGLGSKLLLNCHKLVIETWNGDINSPFLMLVISNPRSSLLSEPPLAPEYFLTKRNSISTDNRGTRIEVLGYDGGNKNYSFEEIERYLYLNTALGLTKQLTNLPQVTLKVGSEMKILPIGFKFITHQINQDGSNDWRTVVIDPPIEKSESIIVDGQPKTVTVALKGGFTLDTGKFGLSPFRYNTGLRLSVKGIPYFQLYLYEFKGSKFQQYKDLCSFIIECDEIESKLNIDRSNISNQQGNDPIVKTFRKLTAACFDDFTNRQVYIDFVQKQKKEDEKNKAQALLKRQAKLTNQNQEYVCILENDVPRVLHKVPDKSEQDTLAVFWKLESLQLLPFAKFITWEHTKKDGIDVIATYQLDDESSLVNYITVEFEYRFENFIDHKHNPKQTHCIFCWIVETPSNLRKVKDYFYWYDVDGVSIPVFEISKFPKIIIKKFNEIQL